MKTKVQKWGNSFGVRIPKPVIDEAGISEGADVTVALEKGRIVLTPVLTPLTLRRYRLKELVDQITPANRHGETDFGPAQGKEIW
jgi:antitoxin MazE